MLKDAFSYLYFSTTEIAALFFRDGEDAAEGVGSVFVATDSDGINAHLNDWIIVATWLSHIAKVEDFFFGDIQFFEEVSHAKDFVHARDESINAGSAADFVFVGWSEGFGAGNDGFALLAVWVPGIFYFGAGFLTEGREGDLAEAVFDNLIAFSDLVLFPVAELFGGLLDGLGDFGDLIIGKWVIINLFPFAVAIAIILCALSDEKMQMFELLVGNIYVL